MAMVSDDVMFLFSHGYSIYLFTCSHLVKEEAYLISHIFRLNKQKVYAVTLSLSHPMHHQQSQRRGPTFCLLDTRVTGFVGNHSSIPVGAHAHLPFFWISHKQCETPRPC